MEDILLACRKCGKQRNVNLEEARAFNKDNPYTCFDCQSLFKESVNEPEQTRLGQTKSIETEQWEIDSSPLGNLNTNEESLHPAVANYYQTRSPIGNINVDQNQPNSDFVKQKLEEFRIRREQLDREYELEQHRIRRIESSDTGFRFHMFLPFLFILPIILLPIILFGDINTSSVNCSSQQNTTLTKNCNGQTTSTNSTQSLLVCSTLPGNAGIHQTTANATGKALTCLNAHNAEQNLNNLLLFLLLFLLLLPLLLLLLLIRLL